MAASLFKLAKHLALLSCLLIAGTAGGRGSVGQLAILCLIVSAAVIHAVGRSLERRAPALHLLPPRGP